MPCRRTTSAADGPPVVVRQLTAATLHPGDEVPPPSGKVVPVVTAATTTNVGDQLRLDLGVPDARDLPLVLAARMAGKRLSVAHNGPTRSVHPADHDARWIRQLRSIEVA